MAKDEEGVGAPLLLVGRAEVLWVELGGVGVVPLVHHDPGGGDLHDHALGDGEAGARDRVVPGARALDLDDGEVAHRLVDDHVEVLQAHQRVVVHLLVEVGVVYLVEESFLNVLGGDSINGHCKEDPKPVSNNVRSFEACLNL